MFLDSVLKGLNNNTLCAGLLVFLDCKCNDVSLICFCLQIEVGVLKDEDTSFDIFRKCEQGLDVPHQHYELCTSGQKTPCEMGTKQVV